MSAPAGVCQLDGCDEATPSRRAKFCGRAHQVAALRGTGVTTVRLPLALHASLKAAATERGVPVNVLVIRAVSEFLDRLVPASEIRFTRPSASQPRALP